MAFTMKMEITREIDIRSNYDAAFEVFSDVPRMAGHFPGVEKIEDLGNGTWRWTMEKAGVGKYALQLMYAVTYQFDKENGRVVWEPVDGVGNGRSRGNVKIRPDGDNTAVTFFTELELEIPFSSLAAPVIKPFVKSQFNTTLEKFQKNVEASFGG